MADDGLEYIARTYGVPARRGCVVAVKGKPGTITGSSAAHVKIRLQGEKHAHPYHPKDPDLVYEPRLITAKVDGLGNPIDPEAEYFVQDSRGFVGNCVSWWRAGGAGYTSDLDDVGTYLGKETRSMRDTDIPWPVDVVLRNVARYVDFQRLSGERERAEARRG